MEKVNFRMVVNVALGAAQTFEADITVDGEDITMTLSPTNKPSCHVMSHGLVLEEVKRNHVHTNFPDQVRVAQLKAMQYVLTHLQQQVQIEEAKLATMSEEVPLLPANAGEAN